MPMQADARVFANGEISYAEQLRDDSVANDIPHYAIRMNGLLGSFCGCFDTRNMYPSVLTLSLLRATVIVSRMNDHLKRRATIVTPLETNA